MSCLLTNHLVDSLQKRRNSSPLPMTNTRMSPDGPEENQELPFGKSDRMILSSHAVDSFDTMFTAEQTKRRSTKLPPIDTLTSEEKAEKRKLRRKKASFIKRSSKVKAQNIQEVVEAQTTIKMQSPKRTGRKSQLKGDSHKLVEGNEIYQDQRGNDEEPFDLDDWEHYQDSVKKDDGKKREAAFSASLNREKSHPHSDENSFHLSSQIKVKSKKVLKKPITSPESSVQKRSSECNTRTKLPQIASANEYHVKRGCKPNGRSESQTSPDVTSRELACPLWRPPTRDSHLNSLPCQRKFPVLPEITRNPNGRYPNLSLDIVREETTEPFLPYNTSSNWDAVAKHSMARDRDSDLEQQRQRIRKLCKGQKDLVRVSTEVASFPAYERSYHHHASVEEIPGQNKTKGTRLSELHPRHQSMHYLKRVTASTRVRPVFSSTVTPQASTSTQIAYLSRHKSSVSRKCSVINPENSINTEKSTDCGRRESTQKLDVYEFLREETYALNELPSNSTKAKNRKKGLRDVFQILKKR